MKDRIISALTANYNQRLAEVQKRRRRAAKLDFSRRYAAEPHQTHRQLKAEQRAYWQATGRGPGKKKTPPNQESCARRSATA